MPSDIEGTYTALVTPFRDAPGQPIDWDAFDALLDAQIAGGVTGVVPCGTTGESPTLNHEEHAQVMYRHFIEIAASVRLPVVIYNIPARTGIDLAAETLLRIADAASNVVAVKDATGNVLRAQKVVQMAGARITVLSGDDALTLAMIAVGARGVISVTSNVLPAEVTRATKLALDGSMELARLAHVNLLPVHEAMFVEASPAPVKAALASKGLSQKIVRSPLAPCTHEAESMVVRTLQAYLQGQH